MPPLPARDQVPVDETWNLADIYPSLEAWEADVAAVPAQLAAVTAYQGRLGEGPALLGCLRARDAVQATMAKVGAYARLHVSVDGLSPQNQALGSRAAALGASVEAALSFIPGELNALPAGAIERALEQEPALGIYRRQLEQVLRRRPHLLPPETEQALAALGEALGAPATVWGQATAVDLRCEPVRDDQGREVPVSIAAYVFGLSRSPDRELRRRGYQSLAAGMDRYKATLATTLAAQIKRNVAMARLRRYASATEMILDAQEVPEPVYRNVLNVVHDEMAPHYRRLMRLKQRVLGLDRVQRWDVDAPLDPGYEPATDYQRAGDLLRRGLAVLGEEYAGIVDAALSRRWVDRAENAGKRSGAFCASVYGVHSYVFTTWRNNLRSAFTLAHEFGHAGQGMLAGRRQVISNTRPTLFFIEAPSTCNELILGNYLLDSSDDPRLRRWVILQFLGTFLHNMVTHMLEAHFEQRLYDLAEAGRPLTLATIMGVQAEVFERFYDGTVEVDEGARLYWAQQPHFYSGLYPYTYAAGLSCSYGVADAIRREGQPAADRWLRTLEAGGTLPPLELMRLAGVDMAGPEPIRRAVAFFGGLVDELERSFA